MPFSMVQIVALVPLLGLFVTFALFIRQRRRASPGIAAGAVPYFATVVASGILAYEAGKYLGILAACTLPEEPGNLCGLVGWFLTGPLSAAAGMVIAALLFLRAARRRSRPDQERDEGFRA